MAGKKAKTKTFAGKAKRKIDASKVKKIKAKVSVGKKTVKAKLKKKKSTLIFVKEKPLNAELNRLNQQKLKQVSSIPTEDLQKMQAFGVLPFELRQELSKRLGRK